MFKISWNESLEIIFFKILIEIINSEIKLHWYCAGKKKQQTGTSTLNNKLLQNWRTLSQLPAVTELWFDRVGFWGNRWRYLAVPYRPFLPFHRDSRVRQLRLWVQEAREIHVRQLHPIDPWATQDILIMGSFYDFNENVLESVLESFIHSWALDQSHASLSEATFRGQKKPCSHLILLLLVIHLIHSNFQCCYSMHDQLNHL